MPQQANVFHLHNSRLHIAYSNGSLGSKTALVYQDAQQTLQFDESQMRRISSDLGEEVSVTLRLTPDAGSTSFTLVVPRVQLEVNERTQVETVGITALHRFSIAPALDHGQLESYSVARLRGSAAAQPF
jgi:hypothetical protein